MYNSPAINKNITGNYSGKCVANTMSLGDLETECCAKVQLANNKLEADAVFTINVT